MITLTRTLTFENFSCVCNVCVCMCVCVCVCQADKPTDAAEKGDKTVKTEKVVEKAEILRKKKYS